MKKKPWKDREYLKQLVIRNSGIPEENFAKRYLKLGQDIQAIGEQLYFYNFHEPSMRITQCLESYLMELRKF